MIRSIFIACLFLLLAGSLAAQGGVPQTYVIAGLRVEGTNNVSVVEQYSGLRVGTEITMPGPDLGKAIKRIWSFNRFSDVSISIENTIGNQAYLLIQVEEYPILRSYSFGRGVTNSQADDIREKLTLKSGQKLTPERERRAEREIRNYFIGKGHFDCKVNTIHRPDTAISGGTYATFLVEKGPRMKIQNIKIDGNQDFSDDRLVKKMKDLKEKRFYRVWARSKYIPKKLESSRENLIAYYRSEGYRDAEVVSDTVYKFDDKTLEVVLRIIEGNQYYIRDVQISGNYKYSSDTLMTMLGIERGEVYNSEAIRQKISGDPNGQDIASLYQDDGYLFFNVDPVEVRIVGDSVDLELRVFEGPQATIRKVIVEGNTKTSDFVILRELRTLPGRKFSRSDLIRSQREILALNYFNQETMNVIPIPDPQNGTVDLKFIVEEKPSDQLQVQGGWGGRITDNQGNVVGGGFVGTVQLGFNNFSTRKFFQKSAWSPVPSGDGQRLNLAIQMNGSGWQNYSISFLEPWLGGKKPNSLGASVYYSINKSLRTDFRMATFGSSLDYGMRMKWPDDFFRSYTSLGYKYYDIRNGAGSFDLLNFDDGFINVFSLKQTFDRTSIDAPLYPRSGSQLTLSVEATPPFSLFKPDADYGNMEGAEKYKFLEYHKWKFNSTWYFQVAKNLVIRPRVMYGYLGSYNPDYGISPFERFNMGGSGLAGFNFYGWEYIGLRGYKDNTIGTYNAAGNVVAGNIYNKYVLELRYPISLNQSAPIWLVSFLEAGNTWLGVKNYNPFDLKRAAGLGVRVMLPMVGLLGVDYGYGFDRVTPSDTKPAGSNFTFIIGQEF